MAKFLHTDLRLIQPKFDDKLTDLVINLDHLRRKKLIGTTHPHIFFQLKNIFQILESISSARIEGNNTTIANFIEIKLENREYVNESIQEIRNIEKCIDYINRVTEENKNYHINRLFVSELHQITMRNLSAPPQGEGDKSPGDYRNYSVTIKGSNHNPPETKQEIESYMDELFDFLNSPDEQKYDLLKIALIHHRFMWIHPFGNGNGRVGRLMTYALLIRAGYNVQIGKILNPTAVFCVDRDSYYKYLSAADNGDDKSLIDWCTYVLEGLKSEIDKIDRLLNYEYLSKSILLPALEHAEDMKYINNEEYKILKLTVEKQLVQNSDIQKLFKEKHITSISRYISNLKKKKMLKSESENQRKYHINFTNNFLLRSVIQKLEKEEFIPIKVDE